MDNLLSSIPINDSFDQSISLSGTSFIATGSNSNATGENGEPNHGGVNFNPPFDVNSVWWTWTAEEDSIIALNTFGSNYDTSLAVYTGGSVNDLTEVASNDDYQSLQSQVLFDAIAGETYQIAVDGYSSAQGNIELALRDITPEEIGGKNLIPPDLPDNAKASAHSHVHFPDTDRASFDSDSVPKGATKLRSNVFSTDFNSEVLDSTDINWTSVEGILGEPGNDPLIQNNDVDFYQVAASRGEIITVDIDNAYGGNGVDDIDTMLWVFNQSNELVASNDDSSLDPGSSSSLDSFLQYGVESGGQYYIAVTSYGNIWLGDQWSDTGGLIGGPTGDYDLNISIGEDL